MDKLIVKNYAYIKNEPITWIGEDPLQQLPKTIGSRQPRWDIIYFDDACNFTCITIKKWDK